MSSSLPVVTALMCSVAFKKTNSWRRNGRRRALYLSVWADYASGSNMVPRGGSGGGAGVECVRKNKKVERKRKARERPRADHDDYFFSCWISRMFLSGADSAPSSACSKAWSAAPTLTMLLPGTGVRPLRRHPLIPRKAPPKSARLPLTTKVSTDLLVNVVAHR